MGNGNRLFSIRQLRKFDGKAGRPTYIAFKRKVYDVSGSSLWAEGKHRGSHFAGEDLTEHIGNAPHGEELLMKFPVVGELKRSWLADDKLVHRIQRLHLHLISVHFSIAYTIAIFVLSFLYILTDNRSFELASYYMLVLAFLATPVTGLSGLFSWRTTYEGRKSRIFVRKIRYTIALVAIITACFIWRTVVPDILVSGTRLSYLYLIMVASLTPIVVILGYYGGKIVHS